MDLHRAGFRAARRPRPRSIGLATFFGFVPSSCSYSAIATAKNLYKKGASVAAALAAFQFPSTNLVIEIDIDHPKHDYLAPHGDRRGMGEVLVRAFGYTVAARYLDDSEEMAGERYSHIEAGELGDSATEAPNEVDGDTVLL